MPLPPPLASVDGSLIATQLVPLAILLALYTRRARTLARNARPLPRWRQTCFFVGLATIAIALVALEGLGREWLFADTIESLLLSDLATLLIVLGLTEAMIAPLLRISIFYRLRVLANPLIAFPLWAATLCLWHLSKFYEAGLHHSGIQALEHAMLVGVGVNMWMCLFGPLPMPTWFGNRGRLVYILAVRLTGATLGNLLLWSGTVFYPYYLQRDSLSHISPIADQNIAGALIIVEQSVLTIGLFCWLFVRVAREREERRELLDFARRRGVALSEKRAARAIAIGRSAELRQRVEHQAAISAMQDAPADAAAARPRAARSSRPLRRARS